ncbi:MAG TPA: hypothetical protein PJ986_11105 [Gammaproteobacteria bacterium]|nr:hypothetical protein [Gammaproteobacteria bacterium]
MSAFVLTAGIACSLPTAAQVGAGGSAGSGTGGATAQGSPSSPAAGPSGLPGGAPGVQREPLNPPPGATDGEGRARGSTDPADTLNDTDRNENGRLGTTMSDDEIHQACMMKANPDDCRTRLRNGETDDSIERNPP